MDNKTSSVLVLHGQTCFAMENKNRNSLDDSVYIINAITNYMFCVPTIAVNLILFVVVWRTSSLCTPSNILVCALASTDFCVGLAAQPSYGTLMLTNAIDASQSVKCVARYIHKALSNMFAIMSVLTFTAISLDKLLMVHLHLRYNTVVTNRRTLYLLLFLTASCVLTTAFGFVDIGIYVAVMVFLISTCFIIAFISYVKIYRIVKHHQQQIHVQAMAVAMDDTTTTTTTNTTTTTTTNKKKNNTVLEMSRFKKRTFSTMFIFGVFLLFYLPFVCVMLLTQIANNNLILLALKNSSITFGLLNSLANPLLICWKMRDIRKAVKRFICTPTFAG